MTGPASALEIFLDELAADFLAAVALMRAGSVEAALEMLLPCELAEHELARRVALMVAVGAVVIALTGAPGGPNVAVEDLITMAPSTETSLDMLIDLVDRCTELDRSGR